MCKHLREIFTSHFFCHFYALKIQNKCHIEKQMRHKIFQIYILIKKKTRLSGGLIILKYTMVQDCSPAVLVLVYCKYLEEKSYQHSGKLR